METKIRVLVADDHPIFRQGLRVVIESAPEVVVVAEAENGEVAIARLRECQPDVAVLDLDMPQQDGFGVIRALQEAKLSVKVIFLTGHKSEALFNKAFDAGVSGYVLKDSAVSEILDCIRAVNAGGHYISPQLATFLLKRGQRAATLAQQTPSLADLTQTERRVLQMIAHDKTSREIAAELYISVRTVERHRENICLKLDLHGSNALLRFAAAHKSELS